MRWLAVSTMSLMLLSGATSAQISPGPLSRAHAEFDSNLQCTQCHGTGDQDLESRCLNCHREIAGALESGHGYHAREGSEDCARCHPEHGGRDFALIEWPDGTRDGFDHQRTGWPLEGKHRAVRCDGCHRPEYQRSPVAGLIRRKDREKSWLGLEPECVACHADPHRATLGEDCRSCHTTLTAWKPARGFDHARSTYPLTGKHVGVPCAQCHLVPGRIFLEQPDGRNAPRYKPLPHEDCSSCHRDPHAGLLGPTCSGCHATTSFREVRRDAFDHARTKYPLEGKHASAECASCHDPDRAWGKKPPFATCEGCHRDPHAGNATLRGKATDCASCHTVEGFRPSTYTVRAHDSASYALSGKHRVVACERCHLRGVESAGAARVVLRPRHAACRDCHADAHADQLAHRNDRGACESCHTVQGWKPSTYGPEQHAELRLGLEGRHGQVECRACHGPDRPDLPSLENASRLGAARVALTTLDPSCIACHLDPHAGRFSEGGTRPTPGGCKACHGWSAFRPSTVGAESHRGFAYALEGGHRTVPCALCHEELNRPPSGIRLLRADGALPALPFSIEHGRCESCHETVHGAQFDDRPGGRACDRCHGLDAFRPAVRFDHDLDSDFALDLSHENVACAQCHPAVPDGTGGSRTVYRPLQHRCRDCHGKGASGAAMVAFPGERR